MNSNVKVTANNDWLNQKPTTNNPYMMGTINIGGTPTTTVPNVVPNVIKPTVSPTTPLTVTSKPFIQNVVQPAQQAIQASQPMSPQLQAFNQQMVNAGKPVPPVEAVKPPALPEIQAPKAQPEVNKYDTQLNTAQTEKQTLLDEQTRKVNELNSGLKTIYDTGNLTPSQQQQISNLSSQFDRVIQDQRTANSSLEGQTRLQASQFGSNEGSASFINNVTSTITAGNNRIADLEVKKQDALLRMTEAFKDKNEQQLKSAYDNWNAINKEAVNAKQKVIDDLRDLTIKREEMQLVQEQKDATEKLNLLQDAAKGGAPANFLETAEGLPVGKATALLANYLSANSSGIGGEYARYKNEELAAGRKPVSFNDYQTMDANRKAVIARAGRAVSYAGGGVGGGSRLDSTSARQLISQKAATQEIVLQLEGLKKLYDTYGYSNIIPGDAQSKIKNKIAILTGAVKDAETLGTLDAGVSKLVGDMIGDPSSFASKLVTTQTAKDNADEVATYLMSKLNSRAQQYEGGENFMVIPPINMEKEQAKARESVKTLRQTNPKLVEGLIKSIKARDPQAEISDLSLNNEYLNFQKQKALNN